MDDKLEQLCTAAERLVYHVRNVTCSFGASVRKANDLRGYKSLGELDDLASDLVLEIRKHKKCRLHAGRRDDAKPKEPKHGE